MDDRVQGFREILWRGRMYSLLGLSVVSLRFQPLGAGALF